MADKLRIVVAVLRPSELSEASLAKSSRWRELYETPQFRQKLNGACTKWQSRACSSYALLAVPSALTVTCCGRACLRERRTRYPLRCSSIQSSGSLSIKVSSSMGQGLSWL